MSTRAEQREASFVELDGRAFEYEEIPGDRDRSTLVFLHEGLGSVGLWRGFPRAVADATGRRTVAYSRLGHGWSDRPPAPRGTRFMHEEAEQVLPRLLERFEAPEPLLVGHSDGGSIALIHAATHPVSALVCLAPHVFVEEMCLERIRAARQEFEQGRLRERMARHHRDPEAAFRGWNDVWLHPDFPRWSIEDRLHSISAPVMVIQGTEDPYGTLAHLEAIERAVRGPVERVVLPCGHAPHLELPEETLSPVSRFVIAVG
jgi:pimeloyl-ACP methyl ester carboxylesterase